MEWMHPSTLTIPAAATGAILSVAMLRLTRRRIKAWRESAYAPDATERITLRRTIRAEAVYLALYLWICAAACLSAWRISAGYGCPGWYEFTIALGRAAAALILIYSTLGDWRDRRALLAILDSPPPPAKEPPQ